MDAFTVAGGATALLALAAVDKINSGRSKKSAGGSKASSDEPTAKHYFFLFVLALKQLVRLVYVVYYFEAAWKNVTDSLLFLCVLSYMWRVFGNHAGGHRYFAHRSFEAHPAFELALAVTISMSNCSLLYWATEHNIHHAQCEREPDSHSPHNDGHLWVQIVGCTAATVKRVLEYRGDTLTKSFKNNLEWVEKRAMLLSLGEDAFWYFLFGWDVHFWIRALPIVLTNNAIRATNTAAHSLGYQPYETGVCEATNCWWVALLNGGEGWHNNHHAFAATASHGFKWYEFDWVYWGLIGFEKLGLAWDLQLPSEEVLSHYNKHERFVPNEKYVIKGKEGKKAK